MLRIMAKRAIPKNGVDYRGKLVLAPMVRSGECPSRLLALRYGADLVWGPETVDKALIGTTRRVNPVTKTIDFTKPSASGASNPNLASGQRESVIFRLHPEQEGRRLIHQIGTANPATAVQAAKLIAGDVAGIDVNAGCPKPFSTSGGMGAALLQTPDTLCSILDALVAEVGIPFEIGISVKIRLLDTPEQTAELVRKLVATGITGLTLHCRTTPMRPRERAIRDQLRMVGDICREAGVACLMNGDVTSREEANKLVQEYGVDGAMIATAAETNPSCFRLEADGGRAPWEEIVKEYVKLAMSVENRWGNTKYLLGQMIPGKSPCYRPMNQSKTYTDLVKIMNYDEEYLAMAEAVDQRLETSIKKETRAEKKAKNKAGGADSKASTTRAPQQNTRSEGTDANKKRKYDDARLDAMPDDIARETAPGTMESNPTQLLV
ncbi:hypothetical protein AAFC00_001732 [Neodothiora populina]|uniref:DUS-like FMN-binding domain-containing protein n=1 Tax=Neodothiora populina TaxID=2781224 RepID=A0ABR3PQ70_9PEZI